MAKLNAHTASRDELAEAGVRADVVDEIVKRRRRKGGLTLEALGDIHGVGPATLEQLGKVLDFKRVDPSKVHEVNRDELKEFLAKNDVGTDVYYPVSLHLQECFAYLGHQPGDLPESEKASVETLALPIFPELRTEQIEFVVEKISEFYS